MVHDLYALEKCHSLLHPNVLANGYIIQKIYNFCKKKSIFYEKNNFFFVKKNEILCCEKLNLFFLRKWFYPTKYILFTPENYHLNDLIISEKVGHRNSSVPLLENIKWYLVFRRYNKIKCLYKPIFTMQVYVMLFKRQNKLFALHENISSCSERPQWINTEVSQEKKNILK